MITEILPALLFLDIDGTVCPQREDPGRVPWPVARFPSPIGNLWAQRTYVDRIAALPCKKMWLSQWEEQVTKEMRKAFGIHTWMMPSEWAHPPLTDWDKADAIIRWAEGPREPGRAGHIVWCDDELADPRNAMAIRAVRDTLDEWGFTLQVIAPDPDRGISSREMALLETLCTGRM